MPLLGMKQTLLNVIMTVEIVVQILTWLVMASVMMKQTILSVTMMVETVVDLLFPVSIYFLSKNLLNQSNDTILYNANIILKKVILTAAQRPYYPF